MTKTSLNSALLGGLLLSIGSAFGAHGPDSEPVDAAYLASQHIPVRGKLVTARRVHDRDGEHILALSRKAGPSPTNPDSGRIEHIELHAAYYSHRHSIWHLEWTVYDFVECPGLDAAADFFAAAVGISDLDGDGKAEITIPYKLFCGGGIDPYTVKVIMRDESLKLAIRGESRLKIPGQEAIGGEHQYDKTLLLPSYSAYKHYMERIWDAVSIDSRK